MTQAFGTIQVSALPNLYPGYLHFSLRSLVPQSRCPCTLRLEAYNTASQRLRLVIAQEPGALIEQSWLARLLQAGINHAYIAQDDLDHLQEYLRAQAARLSAGPGAGSDMQHCLVYEQALCAMRMAMLDPRNGHRLTQGVTTVRQLFERIWGDQDARQGLLKVMTSDGGLAKHCLNVCLLGVGVAHNQGWAAPSAENLGVALFFHDLGLVEMPQARAVCTPQEPDQEDSVLRDHPRRSREFLGRVPNLALEVLETVQNHHENLDGSGFPQGLDQHHLSPASRLARIVDFYESATAGRGCTPVLTPFETLSLMRREMQAKLDQNLLEALVRFLGSL